MFHLAQVNVARARAALTDPLMADFVAALDRINARAEAADGFVWRHTDASDPPAYDDPLVVVNLSLWTSIEALHAFVYRSEHLEPLRRRADWFTRMDTPHLAMWWVPVGHRPTMHEARERLEHLAAHGESQSAFTFRTPHAAPAEPDAQVEAKRVREPGANVGGCHAEEADPSSSVSTAGFDISRHHELRSDPELSDRRPARMRCRLVSGPF